MQKDYFCAVLALICITMFSVKSYQVQMGNFNPFCAVNNVPPGVNGRCENINCWGSDTSEW